MIDVFMIAVTAIVTVVVTGSPLAILWAVGAVRRRRLIAKVDSTTAKVNEAAVNISGAYAHRPELRP